MTRRVQIRAGTPCSVCKATDQRRQWRGHHTRRDVVGEIIDGRGNALVVQVSNWLILVRRSMAAKVGKESPEERRGRMEREHGLPDTVEAIEWGEHGCESTDAV